jgi:hypothetical protein
VEKKVGLFQVFFFGRLKKLREGRRGFPMVIGVMIEKTGFRLLDWRVGVVVVALRRQSHLRKLEDTWPMDGFCTYKYQLAT